MWEAARHILGYEDDRTWDKCMFAGRGGANLHLRRSDFLTRPPIPRHLSCSGRTELQLSYWNTILCWYLAILVFACSEHLEFLKLNTVHSIILMNTLIHKHNSSCCWSSDIVQKFPDICYHCGDDQDLLDGEPMAEIKRQYSIVRPICNACYKNGLQPAVRNAMRVNESRQKRARK